MNGRQFDLFSGCRSSSNGQPPSLPSRTPKSAAGDLSDAELISAIPNAGLSDAPTLTTEAGRRRLAAAVPALERLCRRFTGFGIDRPVPEQVSALEALRMIGGNAARQAVERILAHRIVQGPGLATATATAARLGADPPTAVVADLLRHPDPRVRIGACGCARASPATTPILMDLMGDLDPDVSRAAACALGRLGCLEARPTLIRLLRERPSPEVVGAVAGVADEDCVIVLGRIARTMPDLIEPVLEALEAIDHPRALQLVAHLRKSDRP